MQSFFFFFFLRNMFNHLQLLIGLPEVTRLDHRSIRAFAKEERGRKVGLLC